LFRNTALGNAISNAQCLQFCEGNATCVAAEFKWTQNYTRCELYFDGDENAAGIQPVNVAAAANWACYVKTEFYSVNGATSNVQACPDPPSAAASASYVEAEVTLEAELNSLNLTSITILLEESTNTTITEINATGGSTIIVTRFAAIDSVLSDVVERVRTVWSPEILQGILNVPVSAVSEVFFSEACDERDEVCDDWSEAEFSSTWSAYHHYLYDETEDGKNLALWEFPRTIHSSIFSNNGFCEDGFISNTGRPTGEYYVTFAAHCNAEGYSVTLPVTGTYGCGRVPYVPCASDCRDCGRSLGSARRQLQQLPSPKDARELIDFLVDVRRGYENKTILDYSLPEPFMKLLENSHVF
jgi:hypothetical protein